MGWASAGVYFDAVAKSLIDHGATDELKTEVCSTLIGVFRDGDWDTEDESLTTFADDPAIVEAFRRHEIYLAECGAEPPDGWRECELESGHDGDHDGRRGHTWPHAASAEQRAGADRG